ncbi:hypothetical protein ACWF94_21450 [Streptomyces sp. NPDC055078]
MAVPQVIVVSPHGSGTPLLADLTTSLGYAPYGTMSGIRPSPGGERPGPGEVYPLLTAAYGRDRAATLLRGQWEHRDTLERAFQDAVSALWRVWWLRLGQPVTLASPVDPALETRLTRVPDSELPGLLPGPACWYLPGLDLTRADGGFLRAWQYSGQPPLVFHHRDVRDRIIATIHQLSQPADRVGTLPELLIYRDIVCALPTMDAKITLALTDPGFPGMAEARRCQWMLRHPAVCVIRHEELVGPPPSRERAIGRLLDCIGHPGPVEAQGERPGERSGERSEVWPVEQRAEPADRDLDPGVGAWRDCFTPDHELLLEKYHGALPLSLPERLPL